MQVPTFILDNWMIMSTFISGVIAGNPRIWKKILIFFTMFYSLYKIFLFLKELKNPEFRKFLYRVFTVFFLLISIILFTVAATGCATPLDRTTITSKNFPDMYEQNNANEERYDEQQGSDKKFNLSSTQSKSATNPLDNYLLKFKSLGKAVRKQRKRVLATKKLERINTKNKYSSERATKRKNLIVSCADRASKLRRNNTLISNSALKFGIKYLAIIKDKGITKKQVFKLPLNTCEKYGLSFFARIRHKSKKLQDKWLFCDSFVSLNILPRKDRLSLIPITEKLIKMANSFKTDYAIYAECKAKNKNDYLNKLKLGIFPSRRLNE